MKIRWDGLRRWLAAVGNGGARADIWRVAPDISVIRNDITPSGKRRLIPPSSPVWKRYLGRAAVPRRFWRAPQWAANSSLQKWHLRVVCRTHATLRRPLRSAQPPAATKRRPRALITVFPSLLRHTVLSRHQATICPRLPQPSLHRLNSERSRTSKAHTHADEVSLFA